MISVINITNDLLVNVIIMKISITMALRCKSQINSVINIIKYADVTFAQNKFIPKFSFTDNTFQDLDKLSLYSHIK